MAKIITGLLTVPPGTVLEKHEIRIALALTRLGKDVYVIKPIDSYKTKSPDFYMDGVAWELKSPTGSNRRSISRHIKYALKQSRNIIIDSSRTKLSDAMIELWLKKDMQSHKSLQKLKLMTKNGKVVDIK